MARGAGGASQEANSRRLEKKDAEERSKLATLRKELKGKDYTYDHKVRWAGAGGCERASWRRGLGRRARVCGHSWGRELRAPAKGEGRGPGGRGGPWQGFGCCCRGVGQAVRARSAVLAVKHEEEQGAVLRCGCWRLWEAEG